MSADLNLLMVRLRELGRAHERLSRAVPDPVRAIATADRALQRVLTLLDDPNIAGPLGGLIADARDRVEGPAQDFHAEIKERRAELIKIETTITRRLGARQEDIERLYRDAPLTCIGEGTNEMQRIIISKQLIKRNPAL